MSREKERQGQGQGEGEGEGQIAAVQPQAQAQSQAQAEAVAKAKKELRRLTTILCCMSWKYEECPCCPFLLSSKQRGLHLNQKSSVVGVT